MDADKTNMEFREELVLVNTERTWAGAGQLQQP